MWVAVSGLFTHTWQTDLDTQSVYKHGCINTLVYVTFIARRSVCVLTMVLDLKITHLCRYSDGISYLHPMTRPYITPLSLCNHFFHRSLIRITLPVHYSFVGPTIPPSRWLLDWVGNNLSYRFRTIVL